MPPLATAAEVPLPARPLPSAEAAEARTGSCLLLPGSSPTHQGRARAGADSTDSPGDAHVRFPSFIPPPPLYKYTYWHIPTPSVWTWGVQRGTSGFFSIQVVSFFLCFSPPTRGLQSTLLSTPFVRVLLTCWWDTQREQQLMDPPQCRHSAYAPTVKSVATSQTCAPTLNCQSTVEMVQLNATKQEQAKAHWTFKCNHVLPFKAHSNTLKERAKSKRSSGVSCEWFD